MPTVAEFKETVPNISGSPVELSDGTTVHVYPIMLRHLMGDMESVSTLAHLVGAIAANAEQISDDEILGLVLQESPVFLDKAFHLIGKCVAFPAGDPRTVGELELHDVPLIVVKWWEVSFSGKGKYWGKAVDGIMKKVLKKKDFSISETASKFFSKLGTDSKTSSTEDSPDSQTSDGPSSSTTTGSSEQ